MPTRALAQHTQGTFQRGSTAKRRAACPGSFSDGRAWRKLITGRKVSRPALRVPQVGFLVTIAADNRNVRDPLVAQAFVREVMDGVARKAYRHSLPWGIFRSNCVRVFLFAHLTLAFETPSNADFSDTSFRSPASLSQACANPRAAKASPAIVSNRHCYHFLGHLSARIVA